ncbi:hypothetical protein Droror1_Dr00021299 [Drosera rotundifolia]
MVPSTPASSPEGRAAIAGPVEVAQATSDDVENDEMLEQVLLKDLEEMGFTEVSLNEEILRINKYDMERSVEDLCGYTDALEDLEEMYILNLIIATDKLKVLRLSDQKRENGGRKLAAGQQKNKNPETESHKVGGGSLDRSVLKLAIRRLRTSPLTPPAPKLSTSIGYGALIPSPPMNPYAPADCYSRYSCSRSTSP